MGPLFTRPTSRQATAAHSVTALSDGCTALRVLARTVRGPEYRAGSTSAHKNGSPRKQGRVGHAIDRRPESASKRPASVSRLTPPRRLGPRRSRRGSVTDGTIRQGLEAVALPPSARPKLGVSSGYKRFHRCALRRIFRPSLRSGESDFGYCAAACWHKSIPHFPDADNRFREIFMPPRFLARCAYRPDGKFSFGLEIPLTLRYNSKKRGSCPDSRRNKGGSFHADFHQRTLRPADSH